MNELAAVEALAASIPTTPWFIRVGRALSDADRADLAGYVAALDLEAGPVEPVATWKDASRVAADPDWDRRWWQAEAREQVRLQAWAEERHGPEATLSALTHVTEAALDPTRAAAEAAANKEERNEALSRVAAGAAAQACHLAALALAAGKPAHGFVIKHRIFAAGRWPLGRLRERWYLF
ncbi:MAG: hypothetical protein JNL04_14915 [Rhodospirillaceae bacterium]|nr:hypothetical protein [Rhodospirillaceae bacterium]